MGGPGIYIGVYSLGTKLCLVLLLKPVSGDSARIYVHYRSQDPQLVRSPQSSPPGPARPYMALF